MTSKLGWLLLAGALGTLARYALGGLAQRHAGIGFPVGTLTVNLAGCFLAAAVFALIDRQVDLAPEARTAVMVGFMGAFTTFSTYMLETGALLRDGEWALAALNFTLQNLGGLLAFFLGTAAGRAL